MIDTQGPATVERRLGLMAVVGAALMMVVTATVLADDLRVAPAWWAALTGAFLGLIVFTSLGVGPLQLSVVTLRWLWRALALCGPGLVALWIVTEPTPGVPWSADFMSACVGFASVGWRWRGAVAYVVACAVAPVAVAWIVGAPYLDFFMEAVPLSLTNVGFVAIFQGVRHQFTQLRQVAAGAVAQRAALASATSELAERARVSAFIHDDLLSALQAVATAPRASQTRDQAARARYLLAAADAGVTPPGASTIDLTEQVSALARSATPPLHADLPASAVVVPADVATALIAAAREALRNTARHAGPGATARLTLTSDSASGRLRLEIGDDGAGFDAAATDPRRLGLTGTIRGGLDLVGGSAEIDSAPGHGTRIILTWRPS